MPIYRATFKDDSSMTGYGDTKEDFLKRIKKAGCEKVALKVKELKSKD